MRTRLAACLFVLLLGPSADALGAVHGDPNDVRGRLDIRNAGLTWFRGTAPTKLHFSMRTYGTWRLRRCRRNQSLIEDGCTIEFRLDTKGPRRARTSRGIDYRILWFARECRVLAEPGGSFVTKGYSSRSGRKVSCDVRRGELEIRRAVRWYLQTSWGNLEGAWFAGDSAPNVGWYQRT